MGRGEPRPWVTLGLVRVRVPYALTRDGFQVALFLLGEPIMPTA